MAPHRTAPHRTDRHLPAPELPDPPGAPGGARLAGDTGAGTPLSTAAVLLWVAAGFGLCLWIVGTGWWIDDAPLNTFRAEGTNAQSILDLSLVVFAIAGVVFVGVLGGLLALSLWRKKPAEAWERDTDFPNQSHGNTRLEIVWTATPAAILAILAVLSVDLIFDLNDFEDTELVIQVEGQQWWWQYKYDNDGDGTFGGPGDITTANEMVIPADTDVEIRVTSNDVIHSFWIPTLNGKRDAVPGFTTSWKIQADEPGRYRGTCTEFCGLSHARMQMYVIALDADDYAAWEANQLQPARQVARGDFDSPEAFADWEAGQELFLSQCASCHTIDGVGGPDGGLAAQVSGAAPNLTHFMSRDHFAGAVLATYVGVQDNLDGRTPVDDYVTKDGLELDRANLEAWLRNPQSVKPMAPDATVENPNADDPELVGRGMPNLNLTEEQIDSLVAYLSTLS